MKTIAINFISIIMICALQAQSNFEEAMKTGMDSLHNMKEIKDFQTTANYFERIANTEKDNWLPAYYVSYCYIIYTFKIQDIEKKESCLNIAQQYIERALATAPEESELHALQGFYYQAVIMLDPKNNGQTYAMKANESFDKALEYNESNPRVYLLKGWNVMNTPEAYGGGMEAACPLFQQAKALYDKEETPEKFMPNWGKNEVEEMLAQCTQK